MGMARVLAAEGQGGLLTVPGDIPRVTAAEIDAVVASCRAAPSFTIVPAHDELGSNAVLCAPPLAVPLRFGDDSYFPHLMAARRQGIEPVIVRLPGIGLDMDHPGRSAGVHGGAPAPADADAGAVGGVWFLVWGQFLRARRQILLAHP